MAVEGLDDGDTLVVQQARDSTIPPEEDGVNILVGFPLPPPNPTPGMQQMPCDECGLTVCVSPTSFWLFERAGRALPLGF